MDISVIVTNYNYSKLIRRCIRSLLNQNIDTKSYEIIIVDDCSNDNSVEIIESFLDHPNIKLIKNKKNLGVGAASQVGLENARGKFLSELMQMILFNHPFYICYIISLNLILTI